MLLTILYAAGILWGGSILFFGALLLRDRHRRLGESAKPRPFPNEDQRNSERLPLDRDVVITNLVLDDREASLLDISETGCRLQLPRRVEVGEHVIIEFGRSISAQGWIAWTRDGQFGINFAAPMSPLEVSQLATTKI